MLLLEGLRTATLTKYEHVTPVLQELHSVEQRVVFNGQAFFFVGEGGDSSLTNSPL